MRKDGKTKSETNFIKVLRKYAAPTTRNFMFFDDMQRTFYLSKRHKKHGKRN